jgi:hypothetical protein
MNVKTKKAIMALHKKGHDEKEIVQILSLKEYGYSSIDLIIKKELAIEKALEKPKAELKPEPEKTVLKWTKFYEKDQRTHPADGQKVLVCSFNGCDAVCNFEKTYKIFVTTENNSVLDKVYAWMSVPSPHFVDDMGITYIDAEINNEYLIEQTTLETFDIIDAITPALREAVKHLLVQQGANK